VAAGTGWVTISGLNLSVTQNVYYWLAFTMSAPNTLEYQGSYGTNTLAAKNFTYGVLPATVSGLSYSNNAFVMKAVVSTGNYGLGKRTSMSDASGNTSNKYDARGRIIEEKRSVDSVDYTTGYTYDGADRIVTTTYPTGELVTNDYNGRGLPNTLLGSAAGSLVTSTLYNALGMITDINMGSATPLLKTTFGYYGTDGSHDTTGGYYGRLWEIKTVNSGSTVLQDVKHTWDAGGNLTLRNDIEAGAKESFSYDFLDRLISPARKANVHSPGEANGDGVIDSLDIDYVLRVISGISPPTAGCDANQNGTIDVGDVVFILNNLLSGYYTAYNELGNITSMRGKSYIYGTKPHAVTRVGTTAYTYDNNGSMLTGDGRTITWDVENRPVTVIKAGVTTTFVYDGDGNRVKQTVGSVITTYVNKYYEKTGAVVTTNYYFGGKLIAVRKNGVLSYMMQDSLGSTSGTVNSTTGARDSTITYCPFGSTRFTTGTLPTDMKFTGQRQESTGLYYYGARYYDPVIGRFISADTIIPNFANPQSLNRYSYCLNNPVKYTDSSGNEVDINGYNVAYIDADIAAFIATGQMLSQDTVNAIATPEFGAYDTVRGSDPVMTQALESSTKVVNITIGSTGDAGGSTLPTSYIAAAWDVIRGNGININWTITLSAGLDSSALAPLLGHELYHANDPFLSDSIQEELNAYQYGDKVAVYANLPYRSGFGKYDVNTRADMERAREIMVKGLNMPKFYKTLPLYSATNRFGDLIDAIGEGLKTKLSDFFNK
jgi:RHS repeat-associated protein